LLEVREKYLKAAFIAVFVDHTLGLEFVDDQKLFFSYNEILYFPLTDYICSVSNNQHGLYFKA